MKNSNKRFLHTIVGVTALFFIAASCDQPAAKSDEPLSEDVKIVSLNGTVTEILVELGLEHHIVGVDVASTYPSSVREKPKVGHNRNISAEGVLSLAPNLIVGTESDLKEETKEQLSQTGLKTLLFSHEYNVEGSKNLIRAVADSLGLSLRGDSLIKVLDEDLQVVQDFPQREEKSRVLFIYARGPGTMMVGGKGTQVDEMIRLAGGINVADDITDFKPLTPEALVAYDPQIILLFDSGLSSLGDVSGILGLPGVRDTEAGRNERIVRMDGQLLSGFSPRLGKAILELNQKIYQ